MGLHDLHDLPLGHVGRKVRVGAGGSEVERLVDDRGRQAELGDVVRQPFARNAREVIVEIRTLLFGGDVVARDAAVGDAREILRSEEHTSELQSLMRISYAVFCLKKKKKNKYTTTSTAHRPHTTPHPSTTTT